MTVAEWLKVDGEQVTPSLESARQKLNSANGELVLDFASVRKLDSQSLTELNHLVSEAEQKKVKLVMRAVNVDVYRVLKVASLDARFTFLH